MIFPNLLYMESRYQKKESFELEQTIEKPPNLCTPSFFSLFYVYKHEENKSLRATIPVAKHSNLVG